MIKNIFIIFIILIFNSCSFDTRSGIWTQESISLKSDENNNIQELFKTEILNENELNPNLKIKILNSSKNKNKIRGNNSGALDVKTTFENISKYSFNKIKYFDQFEPKPVFINKDIIFFDKKGTIIRFDDNSKVKWKVNHYGKKEKKLLPILKLVKGKKNLLVTDNFARIYLIDYSNGNLIWKNDHDVSFMSQVQIDNDKFYVLDANNTFICFSLQNGEKLWQFKSEKKLINSQKQTSVVINEENVIFNNSK